MKPWARRRVSTVKFSKRGQRHVVAEDRWLTCCSVAVVATIAVAIKGQQCNIRIEKLPIHEVTCWQCLLQGGFLSRRRKGRCLIGKTPGKKPVHLVVEVGSADDNKRLTPGGCKLDFTKYPENVRAGTYGDVTCKFCLASAVELPRD
jgi:hypothetical protein